MTELQQMVFPAVINRCDHWAIKKAERQIIYSLKTIVLKKTPESPLNSKEIKAVNLKGNQP